MKALSHPVRLFLLTMLLLAITLGPTVLAASAGDASASWNQVIPSQSPPARFNHGVAYDAARQVFVLFGGDGEAQDRMDDTWEYNGQTWGRVSTTHTPVGRTNITAATAYDTQRQRVVLFGGLSSNAYLDDMWAYNGQDWSEIMPAKRPDHRDAHALVYDAHRDRLVLFGGNGYSGAFGDTWEFDGDNWTQRFPTTSPPPRFYAGMAYDEARSVVILFGGQDKAGRLLSDTWEYDGSTWRQIFRAPAPPARKTHAMAYNSARKEVILFGGEGLNNTLLQDTWAFDGLQWQRLETGLTPEARANAPIAYDRARGKTVLFGGGYWLPFQAQETVFSDTWELGQASISPLVMAARDDLGMPYNANRGCSSNFEGCDGPFNGFYAGVCTDVALDAYRSGAAADIQAALVNDAQSNPGRYQYISARNAEDLRRYFAANQQYLMHDAPYQPGDVAFFDWNGDNTVNHVSVISAVDSNGRPMQMVDATGVYAYNPTGLAFEHAWSAYYDSKVVAHGRWAAGLAMPQAAAGAAAADDILEINLQADGIDMRLINAAGKYTAANPDPELVASSVSDVIPYLPGGRYSLAAGGPTITLYDPLISGDQYFVELLAGAGGDYTLGLHTSQAGLETGQAVFSGTLAAGAKHIVPITLHDVGGELQLEATAPVQAIGLITPEQVHMAGASGTIVGYTFEIGAAAGLLQPVHGLITFTEFQTAMGDALPASGVSFSATSFDLAPGATLEIVMDIDLTGAAGVYQGNLLITADNMPAVRVPVQIEVGFVKAFLPVMLR